jgi:hypothetical protein
MLSHAFAAISTSTVLADGVTPQPPVNNFGDTRTGALAGPLGLFLIILLLIATVLLIRNMSARIRKLPREFPDRSSDRGGAPRDDDRGESATGDTRLSPRHDEGPGHGGYRR